MVEMLAKHEAPKHDPDQNKNKASTMELFNAQEFSSKGNDDKFEDPSKAHANVLHSQVVKTTIGYQLNADLSEDDLKEDDYYIDNQCIRESELQDDDYDINNQYISEIVPKSGS